MDDKRRQSLKTKELFDNKLKQLPDMGIAKNKKKDIGLEFLQRIHFCRRQGNNAVCNALQELYGDKWTKEFFDEWCDIEGSSTEFYGLLQ